jgi:hypothetical protein
MDPKPKDNNSVVIDIKNSSTAEKYFCSYCNTRLTPYTQEDMKGGYVCTKCTIEYWPKQQPVKKSSRFDLPGPETDSHDNVIGDNDIPIAVIVAQIRNCLQPHTNNKSFHHLLKC